MQCASFAYKSVIKVGNDSLPFEIIFSNFMPDWCVAEFHSLYLCTFCCVIGACAISVLWTNWLDPESIAVVGKFCQLMGNSLLMGVLTG